MSHDGGALELCSTLGAGPGDRLPGGTRNTISHWPSGPRLRSTVKIGLLLCRSVLVTQSSRAETPEPGSGSGATLPELQIVPVSTAIAAEPRTFVLPTARWWPAIEAERSPSVRTRKLLRLAGATYRLAAAKWPANSALAYRKATVAGPVLATLRAGSLAGLTEPQPRSRSATRMGRARAIRASRERPPGPAHCARGPGRPPP